MVEMIEYSGMFVQGMWSDRSDADQAYCNCVLQVYIA